MLTEQGMKDSVNILARFRDRRLEKDFYQYNIINELNFMKWIIFASGLAYILFLIHDYYYIPDKKEFIITLIIRLVYSLWSILLLVMCRSLKNLFLLGKLIDFTATLFIYTQLQILYLLKFNNFDSHSIMIIIIYLGYSAASSDWLYYTLSIFIFTVLYFWSTALYLVDYSFKEYVTAGIYFALAIVFCSLASYRNCMYKRLLFYKNVLTEHIRSVEQERNQLLETEKHHAIDLLKQEQIISKMNKMAFLRSQIKPHFINNALNTIELLCYEEPEKAGRLIVQLSNYLTYCFDFDAEEQMVPFENELELIRAYIEIEKARFSDRFTMEYDLCDIRDLYVPPLLIQPLIENAIKHAVGRKGRQDTILLKVSKEEEFYIITVEDNGIGMSKEKLEQISSNVRYGGVGLSNAQNRLWELYGQKMDISSELNIGTRITFRIPNSTGEKHESDIS